MKFSEEAQRRNQLESYAVSTDRRHWTQTRTYGHMEGYKRSSLADSSLGREIPFLIHYSSSRTNQLAQCQYYSLDRCTVKRKNVQTVQIFSSYVLLPSHRVTPPFRELFWTWNYHIVPGGLLEFLASLDMVDIHYDGHRFTMYVRSSHMLRCYTSRCVVKEYRITTEKLL